MKYDTIGNCVCVLTVDICVCASFHNLVKPVKVLEITPKSNGLIHNEKNKDDLKVWTVASKNANGRFKREKLTCLVCNFVRFMTIGCAFSTFIQCILRIYFTYFKNKYLTIRISSLYIT